MKILGTETRREPDHQAKTIELACQLVETFGHESIFVPSINEAVERASHDNFDYIFILGEDMTSNRKRLYEHYAGMFPTFDVFEKVF